MCEMNKLLNFLVIYLQRFLMTAAAASRLTYSSWRKLLFTLIRSWWILAKSLSMVQWAASGSTAKRTGVEPTAVSPS